MREDDAHTFHYETSVLQAGTPGVTLDAGDVLRMFDGPFGDAIILGFNAAGDAKMARPYAYAHTVGTTSPAPLIGTEVYTLTPNNLRHLIGVWPVLQKKKVA